MPSEGALDGVVLNTVLSLHKKSPNQNLRLWWPLAAAYRDITAIHFTCQWFLLLWLISV